MGALSLALVVLPLQPFWLRILGNSGLSALGMSIATYWTGIVIGMVAVASLVKLIVNRSERSVPTDFIIAGLLSLALLSFFWGEGSFTDYITGLRYGSFAVAGYYIGRANHPWRGWLEKTLLVVFWGVVIVTTLQLAVWMTEARGIATALQLGPASYAGGWPRLFGAMAGPNQLATFLTISGLWLFWRGKISSRVISFGVVLVVLTFSRSAILGILLGLIIPYLTLQLNRSEQLRNGLMVIGVALLVGAAIFVIEPLRTSFITDRHTEERLNAVGQTLSQFRYSSLTQQLVGHGAGSSGPATFVTGRGNVPENWFLQMVYEYGLLGLVLVLSAWLIITIGAYSKQQRWLVAIIVAMTVNSMFLHPLSDNFPTAIWFYVLLGIGASDRIRG